MLTVLSSPCTVGKYFVRPSSVQVLPISQRMALSTSSHSQKFCFNASQINCIEICCENICDPDPWCSVIKSDLLMNVEVAWNASGLIYPILSPLSPSPFTFCPRLVEPPGNNCTGTGLTGGYFPCEFGLEGLVDRTRRSAIIRHHVVLLERGESPPIQANPERGKSHRYMA